MPNGSGLFVEDQNQAVYVVQNISDSNLYYIFTLNVNGFPPPLPNGGFHYSVVDMRLNGGLGDVVAGQKNISLLGNANYPIAMTAIRHHNNRDVWLIIHNSCSNRNFLAYLITSAGIQPPVTSPSSSTDTAADNVGCIKVSPDGKTLVSSWDDFVEYCQFNSTTGQIIPLFHIHGNAQPSGSGAWSFLEFSIDSKYLYRSSNDWDHARIYQYNATLQDSSLFKQSETYVGSTTRGIHLQMGPNWKIYGDESGIDSMCVINRPTIAGTGCNFQANAVYLDNRTCYHGLPQFLQKYYAYIQHSTAQCSSSPVDFTSVVWPPADSISWDFGDPGSGPSNYSNLPNPSHSYSSGGPHTVELFIRHIDHRTDTTWQIVNILPGPQPSLGPDRTICLGQSTTFDAGACAGCTYLWKNLGTGLTVGNNQTYTTGTTGNYSVMVTSPNGCSGSDTVQLITTPIPTVTNNPLSASICTGQSTNIPLTSSVSGANFHWTASLTAGSVTGFSADSGLVINQVLTNLLPIAGIVTYSITPKYGSCSGTPVNYVVTVNPGDSVKDSITVSANHICAGTPVTFTATPTNPGASPFYQWKVNGGNVGTNSTTYTYPPVNGDVVKCILTSSLTVCISNNPATSNSITIVVNPNLPVSVTLTSAPPIICAGSSVTFTAHPVSGGTTPGYQWYLNSSPVGTNNNSYTFTPINGDLVSCTLTSSETCTTSNPASSLMYPVIVSPLLPISITITASANPFCLGSSVTFTGAPLIGGAPVNGAPTATFQWMVNGIAVGTNNSTYTYNPANGDQVTCILNSTAQCITGNPASSNTITMIQNNNLPAGVSISASTNPFCPGNAVTFSATPNNGGSNPTYQWKVNGINVGINSSTYTYNPMTNDSVRCIINSNLSCVTGNPASSSEIIMSGTLAPIVTFTACFDTITTVNAKPIKLKGGIPLNGTYSGPGVNSLTSTFNPATAGVGTKIITYSYTNAALCSANASLHIVIRNSSFVICGEPLTDIRDNKVYSTVQIGAQCWMSEDLNYGVEIPVVQDQRDNCIAEFYRNASRVTRNAYYQWDELMQYDATPADQGFCPPGWHIPTENDWNILFANYTSTGLAGSPLKYSGFSGFNALLSGARDIKSNWDLYGFAGFYWSSTAVGSGKAWAHGMNEVDPSVSRYPAMRVNAFSVRCVKD